VAIGEPGSLGLQPLEAPLNEEWLPFVEIVAAQLIENDHDR
jgi:hypothetical protein